MNARTAFLAKAAGHVAMRVFLVRSHPSTDRGLGERKLMSGPASMMEDSAIDRTDIDGSARFGRVLECAQIFLSSPLGPLC
jgi:hypothetical protein